MQDKVVVISGATSGIGRVAAAKLAAMGARIVFIARDRVRANDTLDELRAISPQAAHTAHFADLSRLTEMRRVGAEIAAAHAIIDVLINNAGAIFARRAVTEDGLKRTFALNHMSYFLLTAALRSRLMAAASARIINTASNAHRRGHVDFDDLQSARSYRASTVYGTSSSATFSSHASLHAGCRAAASPPTLSVRVLSRRDLAISLAGSTPPVSGLRSSLPERRSRARKHCSILRRRPMSRKSAASSFSSPSPAFSRRKRKTTPLQVSCGQRAKSSALCRRAREPHERLPHPDHKPFMHAGVEFKAVRRENHDGRAMLEPAHLVAFPERRVTSKLGSAAVMASQHAIETMQLDAGDEDSGDRHQRDEIAGGGEPRADHRALVLQNSFSMRLSAIGLTFQVSPEM